MSSSSSSSSSRRQKRKESSNSSPGPDAKKPSKKEMKNNLPTEDHQWLRDSYLVCSWPFTRRGGKENIPYSVVVRCEKKNPTKIYVETDWMEEFIEKEAILNQSIDEKQAARWKDQVRSALFELYEQKRLRTGSDGYGLRYYVELDKLEDVRDIVFTRNNRFLIDVLDFSEIKRELEGALMDHTIRKRQETEELLALLKRTQQKLQSRITGRQSSIE